MLADDTCLGTTSPVRRALQAANPWALRGLRRAVLEHRPDVVHLRMFMTELSPLVLRALADVPTLVHLVNYDLVCPLNTKVLPDGQPCSYAAGRICHSTGCVSLPGVARFATQQALWRSGRASIDLIVANSHWVAELVGRDGIDVDAVVWNGVAERPIRPPLTEPPTISFAGRLYAKKGVDVLLRAMARLTVPDTVLLIAGDGPERARLEGLAAELRLGGRVRFLGHLSPDRLEQELATAWVHVVPSVWDEPFGLTTAEAMMRGTAVVASNRGGPSEIIRHGESGLLVPPADADAMADALARVLSDRAFAERLGAAGARFARAELTNERFLDGIEGLYRRLTESAGRASGLVGSASAGAARRGYARTTSRCRPSRRASATIVSVGLANPALGNTDAPPR